MLPIRIVKSSMTENKLTLSQLEQYFSKAA